MYLPVNILVFAVREATIFLYENIFCKNIEAEIYKIFKNMIRINLRLRFWKGYNVCVLKICKCNAVICFILTIILFLSLNGKKSRASTSIYTGQIHSKTEKSKAIILELYKKYFQPKIGRKIKIEYSAWAKKKTTTTFLKKVDTRGQTKTPN